MNKIREKRESLRWSAERLAKELGTTKSNIYKWETGTRPIGENKKKVENWLNGYESKKESNLDWKDRYYSLSEKYIALLEKIKK